MTPLPCSRSAWASVSSSASLAVSVPMFWPSLVRCTSVREVANPMAPASSASRVSRAMSASSPSVGASVWSAPRSPMTNVRRAACGTWAATSTARGMAASWSRYSGNDSQPQVSPSVSAVPGMSSTPSSRPISQSCRSGRAGAKPTPQLPMATVVTPWTDDGASSGSHVAWPSKWVWRSTKPGVTSSPSASISRWPVPVTSPTSTIRPSSTATSARRGGRPVPSTTVPPRITSSAIVGPLRRSRPLGRQCRTPGRLGRQGATWALA